MKTTAYLYSVLVTLVAIATTACGQTNSPTYQQSFVQHVAALPTASGGQSARMRAAMDRVGFPSFGANDVVLNRSFYSTAFSQEHCEARWVMWALTPDMLGAKGSRYPFVADSDLKNYDYRVEKGDYDDSGYSRGHMMPAADCKFSTTASMECALMSNICPQTTKLNSGPWNTLEMRCREWTNVEDTVYVVCGPVYYSQNPKKIGKTHRLDVPDAFFKVVLSMRKGHEKMIGFVMANNDVPGKMQENVCSVAEIEEKTGIVLFPNLDPLLKSKLDQKADLSLWKMPKQQKRNYTSKNYNGSGNSNYKSNYKTNYKSKKKTYNKKKSSKKKTYSQRVKK